MMPSEQLPDQLGSGVVERLKQAWPPAGWADVHVVLAVSGGADSVAMLRAMLDAKQVAGGPGKLTVAHFNHCLRGGDSDDDARWIADLCRQLGVPLELGLAGCDSSTSPESGLEEHARHIRYDFLRATAEKLGARWVVTAHTADDQVETVLHRLVRGTGLPGLVGIPRFRALSPSATLVRPLLEVWRSDIEGYLSAVGQPYRTDASNTDVRFTRNRIRHQLLPRLRRDFNPEVDRAVYRLAGQAAEAQAFVAARAGSLADRIITIENGETIALDTTSLLSEPAIVIREVCKLAWQRAGWPLQAMGLAEWQRLADLVKFETAPITLPAGVRAARNGARLDLVRTA